MFEEGRVWASEAVIARMREDSEWRADMGVKDAGEGIISGQERPKGTQHLHSQHMERDRTRSTGARD